MMYLLKQWSYFVAFSKTYQETYVWSCDFSKAAVFSKGVSPNFSIFERLPFCFSEIKDFTMILFYNRSTSFYIFFYFFLHNSGAALTFLKIF